MAKKITAEICKNLKIEPSIPNGLVWEGNNHYKTPDGQPCGSLNKRGYYQTHIKGSIYLNHRLIFFIVHGFEPECVDHIDLDTENNSPENLRAASSEENQRNQKRRISNTSGYKGLFFDKRREKPWYGQVSCGGVKHSTNSFDSKENAVKALIELREILHERFTNHG